MHRLVQRNRDMEEGVQPVRPCDICVDGEVVMTHIVGLGQTGQGGELRADEIDDALWQRSIVVLTLDIHITEVALHVQVPQVSVIGCQQVKIVQRVALLRGGHREMTDVERTVHVTERVAGEVGIDVGIERGILELVRQMQGLRIEVANGTGEVGFRLLTVQQNHTRNINIAIGICQG